MPKAREDLDMIETKALLKKYRDYPLEVAIETTGRCNARCVFCPHQELERKNGYMSDAMFARVIDQLKEIPKTHYFYLSPFKVNEPLMDKQIFKRIDIINEQLPNAYIRIFSNFNMVTDEHAKRIGLIKNLSDIDISLNSLDPDEYEALMRLDLNRTKQGVYRLLEYISRIGLDMQTQKIALSRVSQSPETDQAYVQAFYEEFKDYLDYVEPRITLRQEWIDFMPSEAPLFQDQPCARWADINICCDGVVAFCCMDGKAAYPWGDIMEKPALEIFNQPEYRRLREECPNKWEVTPCRFCSQ